MNTFRKSAGVLVMVLVVSIISLCLAGCKGTHEPPSGEHPKSEQPESEHPKSEHPKTDTTTESEHPAQEHPE